MTVKALRRSGGPRSKIGVLVSALGLAFALPACSDNPEGNPDRGSVKVPRNKEAGEGAGSKSPAGKTGEGGGASRDIPL